MKKDIDAFLKVLDAEDNSTGGGSASSVAGSMAAGLAGMVARLSIGKKNLEPSGYYEIIAKKADALSLELLAGSNKDSEAFAEVSKAYGLAKKTAEQKNYRNQAIETSMTFCAEVPLHNATLCLEVLELCMQLAKRYNTNASSDLECAQLLAKAGFQGCAANVRVNLPYLKDEALINDLKFQLEQLEKRKTQY